MNLQNEDRETIYHVDSPIRGEWWLAILLSVLLSVVLHTVAPVQAKPSPVTPSVARALGWCEGVEK